MPPSDELGHRYRAPRHGGGEGRWGTLSGAGAGPDADDAYGDVTGERPRSSGRHGAGSFGEDRPAFSGRHGAPEDPLDTRRPLAEWPPPTALPSGPPRERPDGYGWRTEQASGGQAPSGQGSSAHGFGRPPGAPSGPSASSSLPYGQGPPSPPYGQPPFSPPYGQAPPPPYGQAPPSPSYGQAPPPAGPGRPVGPPPGAPFGGPPSNGQGPLSGTTPQRPGSTAVQPTVATDDGPAASQNGRHAPPQAASQPAPSQTPSAGTPSDQAPADRTAQQAEQPLLAGGTPPPGKTGETAAAVAPGSAPAATLADTPGDSSGTETTALGPNSGKHRRGGAVAAAGGPGDDEAPSGRRRAAAGPGRDGDAGPGPGRRGRSKDRGRERAEDRGKDRGKDDAGTPRKGGRKKRKGSFWRELPLLIVVAIVLTFVIQTFVARIYVIPSASMEQTLHGCTGCANDRVAVDKVSYRFSDPSPGDVVVFKGPPAWLDNDEVGDTQPSGNPIVRGFQDALSLVGLAAPNEKDFVKRVIAVGGQTVQCCDAQNRVLVDGKPITEPYLYYQPGMGDRQAAFDPVQVPAGQLWVMGDNRNNSADARFHGPVPLDDVIGKVRVVVLPITRWRTVPTIDPQTTAAALGPEGAAGGLPPGTPELAGALLAVPVVAGGRRLRRAVAGATGAAPPDPSGRRDGPSPE